MKGIITAVIAIAVLTALSYFVYTGYIAKPDNDTTSEQNDTQQEENNEAPQNRETPMGGRYVNYHESELAFADEGQVVLFFSAEWCPTCSILRADLDKKKDSIPSEVLILKTDYDTETELKQKYGVTYQHTLVQVNSDGELIKKWSNSYTLEEILDMIEA
jgi:thiol-disulfide isomerase/thioredoxin